jgi:hypothetical protein
MELILLSGVSTLGLLVVHLLDYLLEPPLRTHTYVQARVRPDGPPNAVPASLDVTAQYDQAA